MKFFYCEVTWYNQYDNKTEDKVFVFANDYDDVCRQINIHFSEIVKMNIELVNGDTGDACVLFIEGNDEDMVQSIKNSNTY